MLLYGQGTTPTTPCVPQVQACRVDRGYGIGQGVPGTGSGTGTRERLVLACRLGHRFFVSQPVELAAQPLFVKKPAATACMGTKHSKSAKMSTQTQHSIDATGGDAEVAYFALG